MYLSVEGEVSGLRGFADGHVLNLSYLSWIISPSGLRSDLIRKYPDLFYDAGAYVGYCQDLVIKGKLVTREECEALGADYEEAETRRIEEKGRHR